MIIGLLWCFCAYLCISQRERTNARVEKKGIWLGIFFVFFGVCGVLGGILKSDFLLATSTLLAVSVLCIFVFVFAVYNRKKCNVQIPATYLSYNTFAGRRGIKSFAPVFRYNYAGTVYERQSPETYSMKALNKRFVLGQKYMVWINEEAPEVCITSKRVMGIQIFCLIIGLFILACYMVCVWEVAMNHVGF